MRTSLSVCARKKRYSTNDAAVLASRDAPFRLSPYRCDLCRQFHLTSRTKGMFVPRHLMADPR